MKIRKKKDLKKKSTVSFNSGGAISVLLVTQDPLWLWKRRRRRKTGTKKGLIVKASFV